MDRADRLGLLLVGAVASVVVPLVVSGLARLDEARLATDREWLAMRPHYEARDAVFDGMPAIVLRDLSTCPEFAGSNVVGLYTGGGTCRDGTAPPGSGNDMSPLPGGGWSSTPPASR